MAEFRIGAYTYRSRRMDAQTQFAVLTKLAPLGAAGLADLVPVIQRIRAEGAGAVLSGLGEDGVSGATATALAALQPVAKALAAMPDEHRGDVLHAALNLVERKGDADQGWAKIWNPEGRSAMFDDINTDAALMIRIAFEVLKATFLPFFKGIMPA